VEKKGNVFYATDLGKKIVDILKKYFTFMDYNYTEIMEKQLDDIECGKVDKLTMLETFYSTFKKELADAYLGQGGTICKKCGNPMRIITIKKTGKKFMACSGYPQCRETFDL